MTATNHVLTGMVVGALVHQPVLALPVAFASHFVCDALPHFGNEQGMPLKSRGFAVYLASDCGLAAIILIIVCIVQPQYWLLMVACGIAAASPDLMWLPGYIRTLKGKTRFKKMTPFMRFHSVIQWSQTPAGLWVELLWFVAAIAILRPL